MPSLFLACVLCFVFCFFLSHVDMCPSPVCMSHMHVYCCSSACVLCISPVGGRHWAAVRRYWSAWVGGASWKCWIRHTQTQTPGQKTVHTGCFNNKIKNTQQKGTRKCFSCINVPVLYSLISGEINQRLMLLLLVLIKTSFPFSYASVEPLTSTTASPPHHFLIP